MGGQSDGGNAGQGAVGTQAALATPMNQFTPFGSTKVSGKRRIRVEGGPDQFVPDTTTTTLSPEVQGLVDQLFGQAGADLNLKNFSPGGFDVPKFRPGNDFDVAKFRPDPFDVQKFRPGPFDVEKFRPDQLDMPYFAPGSFNDSMQAAEGATFDRMMAMMNPQFDRQEASMQQRLANQGLPQSSRAAIAENTRFDTTRNQALEQAALAAVLAGQDVQAQGFGQGLQTHGMNLGQQAQGYGQELGTFGANLGRQAQEFGQGAQTQGLELARQGQQFGQGAQAQQLELARQGQGYGQAAQTQGLNLNRQGQQFGQDFQTHGQNISQQLMQQQIPYNQMLSLMGMAPIPQTAASPFSGVQVPITGPTGGGINPFLAAGSMAGTGAMAGAPLGGPGILGGAALGGLLGLGAGFF